jgi:hypothetical protein
VPHPHADPGHSREHRRGRHPSFSIFQLRPPLTRGASAQLTTRTLTQTGDNSLVGAINWRTRALPPEDGGAQLTNIIEHTIDTSVILK